jgi:hypothetical protein
MKILDFFSPNRHIYVGLFSVSLLVLSGCGGDNYSKTFEGLLGRIEIAENRLEEGKLVYSPKELDLAKCMNSFSSSVWNCERMRLDLDNAYSDLQEKWDFAADTAEMQSLRLPGSQSELALARDAFIEHLKAWTDRLSAKSIALPRSMFDENAWAEAKKWAGVVLAESPITETFNRTCSALGNSQPNDTDEYRLRIVDICDD